MMGGNQWGQGRGQDEDQERDYCQADRAGTGEVVSCTVLTKGVRTFF